MTNVAFNEAYGLQRRATCLSLAALSIAFAVVGGCRTVERRDAHPHAKLVGDSESGSDFDVQSGEKSAGDSLPQTPAINDLRVRASQQAHSSASGALPSPAWPAEAERESAQDREAAVAPLEAVLDEIRAEPRIELQSPTTEVSEEDHLRALKLYAEGRQARLGGDVQAALSAFERASKLDPDAGEVWRELGNAQMASGLRSSGAQSLERAAALGVDDVRLWAMIGLEAVRRRDVDQGTRWLTAARDGLRAGADPVAISWVEVSLGELLLDRGRAAAGAELLRGALTRVISDSSASAFQNEYATLVRRRPQLWMRVGDAEASIGRWRAAADAYARASAEASSAMTDEIAVRRARVLTMSGHTAEAALAALEQIQQSHGYITEDQSALLEKLGEYEPNLSAAISELAASMEGVLPSDRSRLVTAALRARRGPIDVDQLPSDVRLSTEQVALILGRVRGERPRWLEAAKLARARPSETETIADALFSAGLVPGPKLAEWSQGTDALSLWVRVRMGLPNRSMDLGMFSGDSDIEARVAAVSSAAMMGDWAAEEALLGPLVAQGGREAARALHEAQRYGPAFEAWKAGSRPDAGADELLRGASFALDARRVGDASELVLRAYRADPHDERVYQNLLKLLGMSGIESDADQIQQALRDLQKNVPGSATMEELEIGQLMQRGFKAEAEERIRALIGRSIVPSRSNFDALVAIWSDAASHDDSKMLEAADSWIRGGFDASSPQQDRAFAVVKLRAMRGDVEGALDELRGLALARTPDMVLLEAQLLRQLDRQDEANTVLAAWLDHKTLSVDNLLRLARLELARDGRIGSSVDRLLAVPPEVELDAEVRPAAVNLCNDLMAAMLEAEDDDQASMEHTKSFADVVSFIIGRGGSLPEPYLRVWLRSLASVPSTPLASLKSAATTIHDATGQVADNSFGDTFSRLIAAERTQDALLWAVHVVTLDDTLNEDRWRAVVGYLGPLATVQTVELTIDQLQAHEMLDAAVAALEPAIPAGPARDVDPRAELTYTLAGVALSRERQAQATLLYRKALEYQPDHAWACNDFGYLLLERGDSMDEAERLLEIAYRQLPDRGNVLDSLGWLRYKQGRFVDDPAWGEGAVTLLQKAANAPDSADNPTIHDHFGDALWMAGRDDEAAKAWRRAEAQALAQIRTFNTQELRQNQAYTRAQMLLAAVRDKLRTLEAEGVDPPVATSAGVRVAPRE